MAQKHPGFQWSIPNGAENPQRFFNQKQQGPSKSKLRATKISAVQTITSDKSTIKH